MLSGIQHFLFCKRQWALIHINQVWSENHLTAEGQLMHEKVDQPFLKEKRKGLIISRSMDISSNRLGLSGRIDAIEFKRSEEGLSLKNRKGKWWPTIVEYKHRKKKKGSYDEAQLMAQAMCIEENFGVTMDYGYIYYGETDSREKVEYSQSLRKFVEETAHEMHVFYEKRYIPKARNILRIAHFVPYTKSVGRGSRRRRKTCTDMFTRRKYEKAFKCTLCNQTGILLAKRGT